MINNKFIQNMIPNEDSLNVNDPDGLTPARIRYETWRTLGAIVGCLLYAAGINLFVVPLGLYTGGLMGICQLIRTIIVQFTGINFGSIDIAGIIYYAFNVPLFIMARKVMGKIYFFKTIVCVSAVTIFLMIVPIPTTMLVDDTLAMCLIGGIICGAGIGITLRMGACDGGMDIVGVLLIRKNNNISVGKVNLFINALLYFVCLFMFNVSTVIYCLIYASVSSISVDKMHTQNINVEVNIITRADSKALERAVFSELGRGITKWKSVGAYTGDMSDVLYILVNKYEVNHLKRIVHKFDPHAFIVVNEGVQVDGNFLKRLN